MHHPADPTGVDAAITAAVRAAIAAAAPTLAPEDADRLASSIPDAARRTGLSRSTLYRLMDAGELAYVKIGARRLIPEAALVDLLAGHRVGHPPNSSEESPGARSACTPTTPQAPTS